jgi:hypothetical protein
VYLIGGRLGRVNKVLSIRRRNSKIIIRNVFIDNRIVSLVIRYIKGLSKSIKESIVIRFLLERVRRLIV